VKTWNLIIGIFAIPATVVFSHDTRCDAAGAIDSIRVKPAGCRNLTQEEADAAG
jgi:hypothetical protein